MLAVFHKADKGLISFDDTVVIGQEDKVPPCGIITFLHEGCILTVKDLCYLMIVISDNTATNLLIKNFAGIDEINTVLASYGIEKTRLNRLLFDEQKKSQGIENYFSPKEIGILLELMEKGELISKKASSCMLEILKNQQINHKIPYYLPDDTLIAHKTGEDEGITHDVGIVYSKSPFILCFASNNTDIIQAEKTFQKISKWCFELNNSKKILSVGR
jgi:beta-lactamase class A